MQNYFCGKFKRLIINFLGFEWISHDSEFPGRIILSVVKAWKRNFVFIMHKEPKVSGTTNGKSTLNFSSPATIGLTIKPQ